MQLLTRDTPVTNEVVTLLVHQWTISDNSVERV